MSGQTPSKAAGNLIIEPAEFARRGDVRSGMVALSLLPRLSQAVLGAKGEIAWQASGEVAQITGLPEAGRGWFLNLHICAVVTLSCQRCLEAFELPVDISTRILMVPETRPLPDEELEIEDFDAIPVGRELNLAELIEDELLLSLPLAPRHAECAPPEPAEKSDKQSPFAVLAHLKRGH
ncbi:MAG: hypothetical protein RIR70_1966 [Pseudomonadota bacterium]|jgi:uncharacterized protein